MEQPSPEVEPRPVRTVEDVDMLKAMADPTRLAILAALMKTRHDLPVMSVKELAAELGQPQTKLYRHVRQLEAAGLIKVASTRMVSGILEQRYQACQQDLMFGLGFVAEHADESEAATQTALDRYREGLFAALRAGRLSEGDVPAEDSYRKPVLFLSDLKVSRAKAAELKSKLKEIMDSLKDESGDDPDGVPVNLLIGCYVPADPQPR
ncbi:MAG TPA: winged helix-turn-helix domain-containing protein [Streptosporangiaceae bacterium]|nr:winged helix-turn-helix domain-containing protein [Streptosporangiaceae bacterium]